MHISASREDLTTLGGHLAYGCIVNTTAEIVLLELANVSFTPQYDPETGYEELKITEE